MSRYNEENCIETYVFVCLTQGIYLAHALRTRGRFLDVLETHRNAFPSHIPVVVLKATPIEAALMCHNFNCHQPTQQEVAEVVRRMQQQSQAQQPIFADVHNTNMLPVYYDVTTFGVTPTLTKTGNFLGYVVNANYFFLIQKLFYGRITNTSVNTGVGEVPSLNGNAYQSTTVTTTV